MRRLVFGFGFGFELAGSRGSRGSDSNVPKPDERSKPVDCGQKSPPTRSNQNRTSSSSSSNSNNNRCLQAAAPNLIALDSIWLSGRRSQRQPLKAKSVCRLAQDFVLAQSSCAQPSQPIGQPQSASRRLTRVESFNRLVGSMSFNALIGPAVGLNLLQLASTVARLAGC